MANRTLVRLDEADIPGEAIYSYRSVLRIERSSAGQPGLFFIIEEYEGDEVVAETSIGVPDGWALLAPVIQWLAESSNRDIGELAHA